MKWIESFAIAIVVISCNYRVYTNGKFDHKEKGLTSKWRTSNDSCFVFNHRDCLPDSITFVNQTTILSPFSWMINTSPYFVMTNKASALAKTLDVNVVQEINTGGTKFTRYKFETVMYRMSDSAFSTLKAKNDSVELAEKEANKDYCVVHIKNYHDNSRLEPIYFNDSLVRYCPDPTKINGRIRYFEVDFKMPHEGYLSNIPSSKIGTHGPKLHVGKEYYIFVGSCRRGYNCFSFVSKFTFSEKL